MLIQAWRHTSCLKKTAILNTSVSGMWSKTLESKGVFVYKCAVNNSLGSEYSMSVTVTVNGKQIVQIVFIWEQFDLQT